MAKVTTAQSDDIHRSTDSLETAVVEVFAQLSGKESSLHVPVFAAFSYTASERTPAQFVFRCLPSNGSLSHYSVMFCPFFHGDFLLFWMILLVGNDVINLEALRGIPV